MLTLISYTLCSILLDNHYNESSLTQEELKAGIASLGDVLISMINSLETIKKQFCQEVDGFACENQRLKQNIDSLEQKIMRLTQTIEGLQETEMSLRDITSNLNITKQELTQSLEQQTLLLKSSQQELLIAQESYRTGNLELIEKVAELENVKKKMTFKISQFQSISLTLQGALECMSHTVIADKTHRLLTV